MSDILGNATPVRCARLANKNVLEATITDYSKGWYTVAYEFTYMGKTTVQFIKSRRKDLTVVTACI